MNSTNIDRWADHLLTAEGRRLPVEPISDSEDGMTVADAYSIQEELVRRRVAAGERIVGAKLGLTSRAKQVDMGIEEPIHGWLTDAMILQPDEPLRLGEFIHPRVEPEIVFILGEQLTGPGVTVPAALAATRAVCAGLEVIDSRFVGYRFQLADVVADNASACRFVLGSMLVAPDELDLALLGCVFEDRGMPVATAAGAAVLGHPAAALAELANFLGRRGQSLEPDSIVLSGGLTSALALQAGSDVTATFTHLGTVGLRVETAETDKQHADTPSFPKPHVLPIRRLPTSA